MNQRSFLFLHVCKVLETFMGYRSHYNMHFKFVLSLVSKIFHAQAGNLCLLFLQPPVHLLISPHYSFLNETTSWPPITEGKGEWAVQVIGDLNKKHSCKCLHQKLQLQWFICWPVSLSDLGPTGKHLVFCSFHYVAQ